MRFFWKLPSWLYYSSLGEIATMYAYMVTVNLIESTLVLLVPILLSLLLPAKWYFERFTTKSMWLLLLGLGYWAYFNKNFQAEAPFPMEMFKWIPAAAVAILCLTFLLDQVTFLRKVIMELADRLVIFLYIFLPVAFISLLVVVIRNVF